ncbi:MAG: hypothetical protein Q8J68_06640 [Methanolobus sp.]|uniref:hypothetical protein n=1 Tax=Methanolobus sp. TaxID=1874737 RepID=UPI00272EECF3|nr:hypothetical protein [Methanolobus sp.]MDP2216941.1 hypothetical protein [Methanolobus sp.]
MNELSIEEQRVQSIEQSPYCIKQWENGTLSQQMFAMAAKIMAGMEVMTNAI